MLVPLVILALLNPARAVIGAISFGNGVALLAIGRWIGRFEDERAMEVLRAPRWRWRRENGRTGRGIMDSRDFYTVPLNPLNPT